MALDGLTLMVAGSFVSGLGALLLFGAWMQMRSELAILWWGGGFLLNCIFVAILAAGFATSDPALIAIGSGGVPLGAAAVWVAARVFRHAAVAWWALAVVPLALVSAGLLPAFGAPAGLPVAVAIGLDAVFYAAAAVEFARGRSERLGARWPMVGVLILHAAIFAGGVIEVALGDVPTDIVPPLNSWFSLIHFEQMVFLLASAVFLVMMSRERVEASYITAARIDSLTGVVNRGAFFVHADRIYRRLRGQGMPVSLIAFDLDHFKSINDEYGHAVGDRVLRCFAETAAAVLRPGDLFGRIGGEEFAALLPGAETEAAYVIADRVRHAFDACPKPFGGAPLYATVSAGIAAAGPTATLEALLEAADGALYRAKALGRNRVERAADVRRASGSNVIRVA